MSTLQKFLPYSYGSLSNAGFFAQWQPISQAFQQGGLIQTTDTGQIMWNGLTITGISVSGSAPSQTVTLTYTSLTGPALTNTLAVGRALTISGFTGTNTVLNSTFVITAAAPATSTTGTFNIVYTGATILSGTIAGSPVVTAYTATPSSNTLIGYEIWQFNDSLQSVCPVFFRINYYLNSSSSNCMASFQFGCGSNGSGTLSGNLVPPSANTYYFVDGWVGNSANYPGNWECDFSYDSGRFGMLLWRDLGISTFTGGPIYLTIERSRDGNGNYIGQYYTVLLVGTGNGGGQGMLQVSIFPPGQGGAPGQTNLPTSSGSNITAGYYWAGGYNPQSPSNYAGSSVVAPVYPLIGQFGNPLTNTVLIRSSDQQEGALFAASLYGTSHNYICTKTYLFQYAMAAVSGSCGIGMRFD